MANWTVKQVGEWLKANGFEKQIKTFKEKNIDGRTLWRLADDDISQLFLEVNEDGTIQEPTIGVKSRFRTKLTEWKSENEQEIKRNEEQAVSNSSIVVSLNTTDVADSHKNKHQDDTVSKKTVKKDSDTIKHEFTYLIDNFIDIQFFKNPKFLSYFINYIKQEAFPLEIEIKQVDSKNDESVFNYAIQFIATKEQHRIVRNLIKRLFESIKFKTYNQHKVKKWLLHPKANDIIQNVFDTKTNLFTVCQSDKYNNQGLKIYYFDDEKFNSSQNPTEINDIIQNEILQENILLSSIKNTQIMEFRDINTHRLISTHQICQTEQYKEELNEIINRYEQDHLLISIIQNQYHTTTPKTNDVIDIFGYKKLVDEILQNFKNLFDKYRLRKFEFTQLSSNQLECLMTFCSQELRDIEQEFENDSVELLIRQNQFNAPLYLRDKIESRIIKLFSNLKTKTFKSIELYYDITDKLCLKIKNIAQQNHCYCELKIKTKFKTYSIPRAKDDRSITSKSIIEQSDLFCSSSLVFSQAKLSNGTIEVLIGDIASHKADVIIIPSTSYGLKESLIERAGEIIQEKDSTPFITETTGGNLHCKKILFVNWSLPIITTDDDYLSESIRLFISKTIQYIITNLEAQSIAFAVPEAYKQEEILAEEMIDETINLMKSLSLKVSFVFLPDQQVLHKQFSNVIQTIDSGKDRYGSFYCPTSTITIILKSSSDASLTKSEDKINNYLRRSMYKMILDGFTNWNQYMINAFYKYSNDRCVLPKIDNQQQIVLYGHLKNIFEVKQKYQLMNALIQEKLNLSFGSSINTAIDFKIMLSYSSEDSIISRRLADRLIDEGFPVWTKSNQSIEFNQIFRKINKSDCIILCISENYFQDELCEKEATYAEQIGKHIILVKVQNFHPIEWLHKLIEKESYFQLFGSENHFNSEFDKLLLKILRYTKSGSISSLEQTSIQSSVTQQNGIDKYLQRNISLYFLLTPEQRKFKYDKYVKKIMKVEKGKLNKDDKKDLIKKIQDIVQTKENQCEKYISKSKHFSGNENDPKKDQRIQCIKLDIGILSYKQWLDKIKDLETMLNIPPFTLTGDINDAVFPMLNEVLQNLYLLCSLPEHYSVPIDSDSLAEEDPTPTIHHSSIPKQRKEPTRKLKTSSVVSHILEKSIVDKKAKKKTKEWKYIPKKTRVMYSHSESDKLEYQTKFAEQMQKNEEEFQKFCYNNRHLSHAPSKRKIRTHPTAIFGPSPFSNLTSKPRKPLRTNNKTDLPLKFPWNGVFDTNTRVITWKDSSIFFFFEPSAAE